MIAGTVPYQHAGTPAWLIPARLPLWYMEAIASMYTILASIGCGPHVSSSCGEEDTCASSYVTSTATCEGASGTNGLPRHHPIGRRYAGIIWTVYVNVTTYYTCCERMLCNSQLSITHASLPNISGLICSKTASTKSAPMATNRWPIPCKGTEAGLALSVRRHAPSTPPPKRPISPGCSC